MIGGQIYDAKLSSVTNTGNKMLYQNSMCVTQIKMYIVYLDT